MEFFLESISCFFFESPQEKKVPLFRLFSGFRRPIFIQLSQKNKERKEMKQSLRQKQKTVLGVGIFKVSNLNRYLTNNPQVRCNLALKLHYMLKKKLKKVEKTKECTNLHGSEKLKQFNNSKTS